MDADTRAFHAMLLRLLKGCLRAYEDYLVRKGVAVRGRGSGDERMLTTTPGEKALQ